MKILITHVYSRDNNGDAAIVFATINRLKKTFPNAKLKILTGEKIIDHSEYYGVPTLNSFFYYCLYLKKNSLYRIINTFTILSSTYMAAILYRLIGLKLYKYLNKDIRKTFESYLESDLVLPVGGGYISGKNSIQSNITLIIQLHAILISTLLKKKTILFSQSIGPFSFSLQRYFTRFVLNGVDGIFARENNTIRTLKKIGVKQHLIYRTIDAAFEFQTDNKFLMKSILTNQGINHKQLIGITVRKWLSGNLQLKFEKEIANFAIYLTKKRGKSIVFIPQVTSTDHNDDDRVVNKRIKNLIGNVPNIHFLNNKFNASEIHGIYQNLEFLIGTRMHSVIFSLTSQIPCVAIEYEYKTRGIMQDLGLLEFVIKIEHVTSTNLIKVFDNLVKNKSSYIKTLNHSLQQYEDQANEVGVYLRSIYNKYDYKNGFKLFQSTING